MAERESQYSQDVNVNSSLVGDEDALKTLCQEQQVVLATREQVDALDCVIG